MILVTGYPRSGTSLMMQLLRAALPDRVIGERWPASLDKIPAVVAQQVKALNPEGFWECRHTLAGLNKANAPTNHTGMICKVASPALNRCDPALVERVIYMERHPWAVAKSCQKLVTDLQTGQTNADTGETTPRLYCLATHDAARWLARHHVDTVVMGLESMVYEPDLIAGRLARMIPGTETLAWDTIAAGIRRHTPGQPSRRTNDHPAWDVSMRMHWAMLCRNWGQAVSLYRESGLAGELDVVLEPETLTAYTQTKEQDDASM